MATSSFSRNFIVKKEKEDEFVEEMLKEVQPTLESDFSSKLVHIDNNPELKAVLRQALS